MQNEKVKDTNIMLKYKQRDTKLRHTYYDGHKKLLVNLKQISLIQIT